ncbi:hypothetical protein B0T14DRAFT_565105 [Immersiella caudata]|uniref:Uncharacterized protein n=1 Tax=Immersiella caudata TaxID=314043 RepID=A0AA40C4A8_9PEZI|nr:hypothetical protein B0T14DRAFT_565105 [Immersiella caudata]
MCAKRYSHRQEQQPTRELDDTAYGQAAIGEDDQPEPLIIGFQPGSLHVLAADVYRAPKTGSLIKAKPTTVLSASHPEPAWTASDASTTYRLLSKPQGFQPHTLLRQGKFIVERERNNREAPQEAELGVSVTVSGFGVEVSSKGLLPLLKPYQWIDMWRRLLRSMYVCKQILQLREEFKGPANMERLHDIEDELMSTVKYQLGESDYITVITYSKAVHSGTITLFRASLNEEYAVAKLELVARWTEGFLRR